MKFLRHILFLTALAVAVASFCGDAAEVTKKKNSSSTSVKGNKSSGKTSSRSSKKKQSKKAAAPKETSRDVKKKESAAQKEIKDTQQRIEANDKEVAANLSLLHELDISISSSEKKLAEYSAQVKDIDSRIESLSGKIAENEQHIEQLRGKYIEVVKKMRRARKQTSMLGFIFSSKNFYQAYRRLRYLKQFSAWRRRQVATIRGEIKRLNEDKAQLASMRVTKDRTLGEQRKTQAQLASQQARQKATVAELRANGDALRAHLAKKQEEANQLRNRMTELIAAEQAAAEEARRRQQEQQRLEAERKAKEEAARKLEQEKKEQERKAAEEEARKRQLAENQKKETPKKETPKKETAKKDDKKKETSGNSSYAEARGRTSRSKGSEPAKSTSGNPVKPAAAPAAPKSDFASMKGALPRPVSGSFSIINRFGPHPLPDLPDVMYDNPGIDALVKKGEKAKAVYDGTVSGVYMINGFSNVVLVNHGEYFTVYGNIASPSVSKGQSVKQGQALGTLASDPDDGNRTTIHFEVWKGRTKLNPAEWIR